MAWTALEVGVQPTSLPLFLLLLPSLSRTTCCQILFLLLQLTLSWIALGCDRKYRQDVFQSPQLVSLPNERIPRSTSSVEPAMTPLLRRYSPSGLLFRTDSLTWMDVLGSTTPTTEPAALPLLGVRRTHPTRSKPLRSKLQQSLPSVL